ncbi:phosphopantothenate/pantothenate synthetase [Nanoarchaeota archaeon]
MIPDSHPRSKQLNIQDRLVEGVKRNITCEQGLIAHGRGEAYDYLIGEKTNDFADEAIIASAILLKEAKHAVLSINGNVAALCPEEMIKISEILNIPIEVNIFHSSKDREENIASYLKEKGAKNVLLPDKGIIQYIESNRRFCNQEGIEKADVVFVPLEDGDRCIALRKMGKKVITIDLNPLSRTSQEANVTIVDNIVRALPLLIEYLGKDIDGVEYNNQDVLKRAVNKIRSGV